MKATYRSVGAGAPLNGDAQLTNTAHDPWFGRADLHPRCAKLLKYQAGNVLCQGFKQVKLVVCNVLADAFGHRGIIDGIVNMIGEPGTLTGGQADFEIKPDGLWCGALPVVNADNHVYAEITQKKFIHGCGGCMTKRSF